jgi:hypothetical protein
MERKLTFNNLLMVKLDPENKSIKLRNGFDLYIDTSFEPEKHLTVTGEVYGLPSHLSFTGQPNLGMPWETPLEIKMGDSVIMYYLPIQNAFKPESRRYVLEGEDRYVFISYENIYAIVREGKLIPINGYCLIEPCSDPFVADKKRRLNALGLELVQLNTKSNTHVSFGIVRHLGVPNRRYVDSNYTDEGCDIAVGDTVVMRRISDIPLQYNLHQKVNEGKPLYRVQRRNVLAKI